MFIVIEIRVLFLKNVRNIEDNMMYIFVGDGFIWLIWGDKSNIVKIEGKIGEVVKSCELESDGDEDGCGRGVGRGSFWVRVGFGFVELV